MSLSKQKKLVVVIGRVQNGKSTIIKHLCGQSCEVEIGTGNGKFTTKQVSEYESSYPIFFDYSFLDCPGLNDDSKHSETLTENIENKIIEISNVSEAIIIVVESVSESSHVTTKNLGLIKAIFGKVPAQSIIYLLTKSNLVKDEDELRERTTTITKILRENGLEEKNIMSFHSPCEQFQNYDFDGDLKKLKAVLDETPAEKIDAIIQKRKKINDIAQAYQRDNPIIRYIPTQVPKVREVQKSKEVIVSHGYNETYTTITNEVVYKPEYYDEPVMVTEDVKEQVPVHKTRQVWAGRSGKIFGKKKTENYIEYVPRIKKVEKIIMKRIEKTVSVTVPKQNTHTRWVPEVKKTIYYNEPETYYVTENKEMREMRSDEECLKYAMGMFKRGEIMF